MVRALGVVLVLELELEEGLRPVLDLRLGLGLCLEFGVLPIGLRFGLGSDLRLASGTADSQDSVTGSGK